MAIAAGGLPSPTIGMGNPNGHWAVCDFLPGRDAIGNNGDLNLGATIPEATSK